MILSGLSFSLFLFSSLPLNHPPVHLLQILNFLLQYVKIHLCRQALKGAWSFDQTFDFACSLKIRSQQWHQRTLKLGLMQITDTALRNSEKESKTRETALLKMLHRIKCSLSFVSDQACCRTKTAKVTKYFIETFAAIGCGKNLQNTQSKQIWQNAGGNSGSISIFVFTSTYIDCSPIFRIGWIKLHWIQL